ncbi:MAG TPA: histidine kinase [Flavisolibacter sp.]|jgi:hypothetical protein|nr:histidine kinase [Flavisolibacter sp.]
MKKANPVPTFNRVLTRVLLHICFWILVVCYFAWGFGFSVNLKASFLNALLFLPGHMIMVYSLLYVLTPRYLVKKKYLAFALGFLVTTGLCAGYAALANIALTINKEQFRGVKLDTGRNILPFIHVAGIAFSIKLLNYWNLQKRQTIEAQREQLTTELELLKAQIHPHFLFNTLNNLYAYTLEQSDKAPEIVLKLSALLRFMIYESKAQRIPLHKELSVLQSYIDLEKLRYGKRLDVSFVCRGVTEQQRIAPLLLLPFLENAFKHGTSRQIDQCWISFDLFLDENQLQFKLINSIEKTDRPASSTEEGGLGLQNVRRRLALLYPGAHHMEILEQEEVFIVNLTLDLEPATLSLLPEVSFNPSIEQKYDLEVPYRG